MRSFIGRIFIVAFALCVSPSVTLAQDYNCDDPVFQLEMNYCTYQDFLTAEKQLNIEYSKAIKVMKQLDSYAEKDQQGGEEALRKAQRLWIEYRNAACIAQGYPFHGGTMEPQIITICELDLTLNRIENLKFISEVIN